MFKHKRKLYSQNFFHSRKLVKKLVDLSFIDKNDRVIEIGPGEGIITQKLTKQALQVTAVEIDSQLTTYLKQKFRQEKNLKLVNQDILHFSFPVQTPYKIFANLPFRIESQIVKKILNLANPPQNSYLVVDQKFASRLIINQKINLLALSYYPFFEIKIIKKLKASDFSPQPEVKPVFMKIAKRTNPLLPPTKKNNFQLFIQQGFGQGAPVYQNLKKHYSANKVKLVLSQLSIAQKTKPSHLSTNQWLKLFNYLN